MVPPEHNLCTLRVPKPAELSAITLGHGKFFYCNTWVIVFKEFPPRGLPASFSVGDALKMISKPQHN